MATRSGALGTAIVGGLSATMRANKVTTARLQGVGSLAATPVVTRHAVTLIANLSAPQVVLTDGDMTATVVASPAPSDYQSVFSNRYRSSAKLYFEAQINLESGSEEVAIGIANSGAIGTDWAGKTANSVGYFDSGNIYIGGSGAAVTGITGTAWTTGDTVCVAIDLINELIWFRRIRSLAPSNWNNPSPLADPATGVGGLDISGIGSNVRAMATFFSPGQSSTMNFGASPFFGTIPHGFIAFQGVGDAAASVTNDDARLGPVGRYAIGQGTPNDFPLFIAGGYGEANMVGTTEWIALVESMRAKMGFAARIEVTKL